MVHGRADRRAGGYDQRMADDTEPPRAVSVAGAILLGLLAAGLLFIAGVIL
jgi:choline-glycine betaine transporter